MNWLWTFGLVIWVLIGLLFLCGCCICIFGGKSLYLAPTSTIQDIYTKGRSAITGTFYCTKSPNNCSYLVPQPFLLDPGVPGVRSMGCLSQTEEPFADLTDVTLADEDTNLILTDNANRAIQVNGNVATN